MRVALHRVESDCLKPIYDNEIQKEETLELVVPDVSADIGKILDVRGQFLLSSQKAKNDEIIIAASVEVTVIYAADDSGKVQYVMTAIPINMTIPVVGADENSKIATRFELCNLDARTLNPRKLLLRASVTAHASVYVPDKFVLWDNLSEGETAYVYVLQKEVEHTLLVGIREKSFAVSDEYRLSEENSQNVKMLSATTEVCVQDAKAVGNKVVVKASANTTAVFLNETNGSLFDCPFTTQFSQIIEVDTYGDNIANSVTIQLKDAEFSIVSGRDGGFVCAATFHLAAQVVGREMKTSVYVADAYSNEYQLTTETVETKLMKCLPEKSLMLNLRGKIQSKTELSEIMYAAVNEICCEVDGNEICVSVNVGGVGKCENGELEPLELKLNTEEKIELSKNQKLILVSVCPEKPMLIGMAHNCEVCVDLAVGYIIREFSEISAVCCLEISEDNPISCNNRPSLVVLCSDRDSDLWCLAKKYGSTMEMIENANKIGEEFCVTRRPLLIPRAKR